MGGGSTPATQTQQTSSNTGPPTETRWMHNELAGQIYGDYQNHPQAPDFYKGSTVADFSPQTENALTAMYNRGAAGSSGALNPAFALANDTTGGKYLDLGSNPYYQKALAYSFEPQTEQFMNQVVPGLTSQFAGAGRVAYGGEGAHAKALGMATDSLNRAQAGASAQAANQMYGDERGRQMQAASMLPQLAQTKAGLDYQDIQAMLGAGETRDQQAQRKIDADVARWNYDKTKDINWKTYVAQQLGQAFPGSSTTGFSTGWSMPSSNPGAQTTGAVTSAVGMGLSAAAMIM